MVQRYISAEQSIAAAGAAFACGDDDFSDISLARAAANNARRYSYYNEIFASCRAVLARLWQFASFR